MQDADREKLIEENKKTIEDEFEKLHTLFQVIEQDILNTLKTKQLQNDQLYDFIKKTINEDDAIINRILEKHKDKINSYTVDQVFNETTKQHIEIIKDNDEAKQLIENKLNQQFGEYQEHYVEFYEDKINEILELIKNSFTFKPIDAPDDAPDDNDDDDDSNQDEIETLTKQQINENQKL